VPEPIVVTGVPVIVGGRFTGAVAATVRLKGARAVLADPSLTVIVILLVVPTFALIGVPVSWPVEGVNVAHAGLFWMLKVSVSSSASSPTGVKE
jgi:hypothetical protein